MALLACPECQKEISDQAPSCPQCGVPLRSPKVLAARRRRLAVVGGVAAVLLLAGGGVAQTLTRADYSRVEQLRAQQDAEGTHDDHVRQRFYRLYKAHDQNAMYIYLWARCVDDAAEQLALAQQGIRADPKFAWNYNIAARALARMGKLPEAYDQAAKGAALDPANMQLADKQRSLKVMIDHKLADQARPAPNAYTTLDTKEAAGKGAARYQGLFRAPIRSPDRADFQALGKARVPDAPAPLGDLVRGFSMCANPFADACLRVYVPRDDRLKATWARPAADVAGIKEHQLVTVTGTVVSTAHGDSILLADSVTVEGQ